LNTRLFAIALALVSSVCLFVARPTFSQNEDEAEAEARKSAERFLFVLERNPRRGTALDKVVEFHLDHESLDELIIRLREKAEATEFEDAGRAWFVVGLIESSQGDAEEAQTAFERAEELLPKSAIASFSLGQNLMTLNRWADAAVALERAVQRKPAPTDLLDVFQTLGRVQQRLAPGDQVIEVWTRLEKLVPNDPRVPELIAKTLLDDGHWEAALPRFEALTRATKDLYRRSEFELEAVDLRLKLGQFEKALAEADRLLGGLKQDHWLFRETRRRVEEAFLAKDDAAGLIKHYEERLVKQPDDLDAVVRLSRALVSQDRRKDARTRLDAGIKLAPTSVELRLELIELLQSDQQFAEVLSQYEELDRIAPNNPDYIRDWGFLILKSGERVGVSPSTTSNSNDSKGPGADPARTADVAKRAAAVWRKLVDAKPKDAVVAAQVAGLMASADKSLLNDAVELLRKAIELEPEALTHREQLGEVLDSAGKKNESLAAWRSMAEAPRRNANNLAQLAEVLSRFGYRDETLTTIDAACELDRKSLELRFQQAELRRKWKQFDSAMSALAEAAALADTPETFDRVVQFEVKVLTESELLTERIEVLNAQTQRRRDAEPVESRSPFSASSPSNDFFRLAKYLEAADKLREATVAARKAVELAPRNGLFLQAAAKMLTLDSQWLSAVELYERLWKLDRRFRIDALRAIAELEQKLGRKEKALKAGRELLAAAPGNPESAEFVVDVCLRYGQNAEALQILRRASRQNGADKRLALKLVERLMEDGLRSAEFGMRNESKSQIRTPHSTLRTQTDEAREILWRVFEQTAKSDDRIEVIRKLAELSVFPGEFTKLVQRLERYRAEPKLRRDASLALVQVHEQAGDTQQARRELERWLPQAPRDAALLARMVSLCETAGDLEAAIAHQQRLAEVTRKREADEHLVVLLRRAGRDSDAEKLATRWLDSERDPAKALKEIDRLLANGELKQTLAVSERWIQDRPDAWEFLFRSGMILQAEGRNDEAFSRFDALMQLRLPDETPSSGTSSALVAATSQKLGSRFAALKARTKLIEQLVAFGSPTARSSARSVSPSPIPSRIAIPTKLSNTALIVWTTMLAPADFGQARVLVLFQRPYRTDGPRGGWDAVYSAMLADSSTALEDTAKRLTADVPDDPLAHWLVFKGAMQGRPNPPSVIAWETLRGKDPISESSLASMRDAYARLQQHPELRVAEPRPLVDHFGEELIRAGKVKEAAALLADYERNATTTDEFSWLLFRTSVNGEFDAVLRLLPKYAAAYKESAAIRGARVEPTQAVRWVPYVLQSQIVRDSTIGERLQQGTDELPGALKLLSLVLTEFADLVDSQGQVGAFPAVANQMQIWKPSGVKPVTLSFPPQDSSVEAAVMGLMYQTFESAKQQNWSSSLLKFLERERDSSPEGSRRRYLARLAVACVRVWDEQFDPALAEMRELFDAASHNPALQIAVVVSHHQHEQLDVALHLLDRIETKDSQQLKEIEQRAVQLAGKLRRTERLQLAAERLFGMKLEPADELQLASTLSGLGLHEHAEAIRQRLPQRAGNNLAVLQQAMQERIDAKQMDEACQIAEQIIRRTSPANTLIGSVQQSTFGGGQQARVITTTSTARTKALAVLGQQGRLGPLIEQAEQQFDRSPQSLKLFGQLAELYGAAGTPEKQTGLLVRLADSDAPDPQFRLTLARALVSAGKAQLAVPHFLFAIERLPNATAQVLFEAEQILSELGHVDELAAIVLKSKLAVNDQQRIELFRRIVFRLEGPPIRARLIIQLFEKAFREAPDFRARLASQLLMLSGSVWNQEELWPLARDMAVPPDSFKDVGPWYGIDIVRKSAGSPANLLTRNVIELAKQIGKLDELETHTLAAMKSHPDWTHGGNLTLGLIHLRRQGSIQKAIPLFEAMLRSRDDFSKAFQGNPERTANFQVLMTGVGHELAVAGNFAAATEFYELTTPELALEECRVFGKEPAMQELAVRIVNRMLTGLNDPDELARQAGSPLFVEAAKITAEIDQPYVAARLAQAMITRWQLPSANNSDGGTWLEQLEHRFANSRAAIKPEMLPAIVVQTLTSERTSNRPDVGVRFAPRIDLLTHVVGDSLTNLQLDSPFVLLIKEAAQDKDLLKKWTESLRRTGPPARPSDDAKDKTQTSVRPTDLSLALLASLTELFSPQTNDAHVALPQLVEITKSHLKTEPPRTAPAGFHPQLGLWLVARECLAHKEYQQLGHELAELATESAALHADSRFQWAILRERGELALKAGDKDLASKLWTRLAVDVLRPRSAEETVAMMLGKEFVWSANWLSTRLHRARDLCRLTLNAEMSDLSLAIFRDTINWPKSVPFQLKVDNDTGLTSDQEAISATALFNANFMASSHITEDILVTWETLESEWRAKGVAADAIFATLLECVLPSNRPDEVFVFAVAHAARAERRVPSLALRLVELAVAEKRIDTLAQRLIEREKTATNVLPLRLIQLLITRLTNDDQRLDAELTKLAQHDWSKPALQNNRIATQIVLLLTTLPERREQVAKLFEQWIAPVSKAYPRDEHPMSELRRWLAKQQLDQRQMDKAKETISSHLRHMDQAWSATGAMDGQHLRRLELLAIATDYASAGLTQEAIALLAQVADARWPDRYADENPGPVLTILAAKLKTRPAQERYELWRAWSLPNDGVKSMRMLTGSGIGDPGAGVTELKSTAFLLLEAAREADRLAELDAFVEEQMKQRPSDRIHVLLALIHLANKVPAVAETLVRQQITLWESQTGKSSSATRTRVWDDWLLSVACSRHESLHELAEQLAKRAESGARELKDQVLLNLLRR